MAKAHIKSINTVDENHLCSSVVLETTCSPIPQTAFETAQYFNQYDYLGHHGPLNTG